jgi:hypothetical protein
MRQNLKIIVQACLVCESKNECNISNTDADSGDDQSKSTPRDGTIIPLFGAGALLERAAEVQGHASLSQSLRNLNRDGSPTVRHHTIPFLRTLLFHSYSLTGYFFFLSVRSNLDTSGFHLATLKSTIPLWHLKRSHSRQ